MAEAEDGERAMDLAATFRPRLALVDGGLPGMDGRTVARRLRQMGEVGIIFVTGADGIDDVHAGFDAGGDDYVVKPFEPTVLLRRVQAVLRRLGVGPRVWEVGDLVLDEGARRVTRGRDEVALTPVEMTLLTALARHVGQVVPPQQLLSEVWGYSSTPHVLEIGVSRLRAKLEKNGRSRLIHTVRNAGYVLRA